MNISFETSRDGRVKEALITPPEYLQDENHWLRLKTRNRYIYSRHGVLIPWTAEGGGIAVSEWLKEEEEVEEPGVRNYRFSSNFSLRLVDAVDKNRNPLNNYPGIIGPALVASGEQNNVFLHVPKL